jgi:phage repressor protein C with HTH and peptisase S24 domain
MNIFHAISFLEKLSIYLCEKAKEMAMTKRERVKLLRKALGKTQQEFANELGLGFSAVSHAEREHGTTFYSRKVMEKMSELYNVNLDWILTGTGTMFRQAESDESRVTPEKNYGPTILVVPVDSENNEWVTVVPEYALASYSEGYRDTHFIAELPMETIPEDLNGLGTIRKFQVYGDSMEPEFHQGDWVYCSYTNTSSGLKIRDGEIYVIVSNRGPLLKRVHYKTGSEYLLCVSTNPAHEPFDLHLSEVRELWQVRRRYTAHFSTGSEPENEISELKRDISETNRRVEEIVGGIEELKRMFKKNY